MKKRIFTFLVSIMMIGCLLFTGCSNDQVEVTSESKIDVETTEKESESNNKRTDILVEVDEYITEEYSVQHSAEIIDYLNTNPTDNVIFSETSLNMALSMLYEGTDPESNSYLELINYLDESVYENDIESIRARNNWLINSYLQNNDLTIRLANSVWSDDAYTFNLEFSNAIQNYYNGESTSLSFNDENSANIINQWCSDNTEGCIKKIVDSSNLANHQCMIMNALYFSGLWENPFTYNNCIEDEFTNADGSISTVTMMHDYDAGLYYSNEQAEAFMRYYEGHEIAFVGILPRNEEFNLVDLDIDSLLASGNENYQVHAIMPSFVVEDNNSLLPVLNEQLPDSMAAVYPNILNEEPTIVSEIIQMTYVDINPEGTEAAAVTSIGMKTTSAETEPLQMVEINLNRPFVFMIYDTVNHEVLFMGRINQL